MPRTYALGQVCKHGQLARSCEICFINTEHSHTFTDEQQFYIRSMGKLLRVTAILSSDETANDYMEKHDSAAVVAVCGPFIFIANKWDTGTELLIKPARQ